MSEQIYYRMTRVDLINMEARPHLVIDAMRDSMIQTLDLHWVNPQTVECTFIVGQNALLEKVLAWIADCSSNIRVSDFMRGIKEDLGVFDDTADHVTAVRV